MKTAIELIREERQRQIDVEGWTTEHDDSNIYQEMAIAGSIYANPHRDLYGHKEIPVGWPWADEWWKPTPNDRVRELVKAGALIAAEIDRLNRKNTLDENKESDSERNY